jgi:cobalamin biosynthesis Mg chelatase CobN
LVAELQAAQAKLATLTAKNQQLGQENQVLRQEITRVLESVSQLQTLVDTQNTANTQPAPRTTETKTVTQQPVAEPRPRQQSSRPRVAEVPRSKIRREVAAVTVEEMDLPMREPIFITEQEVRYYRAQESEAKELSNWLLIIIITLIMVTAFAAGYWFVRPLFQHQNR